VGVEDHGGKSVDIALLMQLTPLALFPAAEESIVANCKQPSAAIRTGQKGTPRAIGTQKGFLHQVIRVCPFMCKRPRKPEDRIQTR
jgi:hypothetical protein